MNRPRAYEKAAGLAPALSAARHTARPKWRADIAGQSVQALEGSRGGQPTGAACGLVGRESRIAGTVERSRSIARGDRDGPVGPRHIR